MPDFIRVAAIGGFYHIADPALKAEAQQTGRDLGREIARAGMGLVVYFSNEDSLEPYVVAGFVQELKKETGKVDPRHRNKITIRFAAPQAGSVRFREQTDHPELFVVDQFPGNEWEAPFYRSLAHKDQVDAVILVAGRTSTLIAGQIAVARDLPVLAVGKHGGSAETIYTQLATRDPENHPAWGTRPAEEVVGRLKSASEAIAAERRAERNRRRIMDLLTGRALCNLLLFIALLGLAWVLSLALARQPDLQTFIYVMLSGWVLAGITGAVIREATSAEGDRRPFLALLLGGIAGALVGLAYALPQWIHEFGPLDPDATRVTSLDKVQFLSALLVAFTAGLGFDIVISRLRERARDVEIGPPVAGTGRS